MPWIGHVATHAAESTVSLWFIGERTLTVGISELGFVRDSLGTVGTVFDKIIGIIGTYII